jgi:UDP-GlcNAc:undecaprenyl-phosphate GlcNAc-1-phosphate transferase
MPIQRFPVSVLLTAIGAPFAMSLLLTLAVVPLCRATARRFNFLARPRQDRWHQRPVALFGGVGIAVVVFATAAVLGLSTQIPILMASAGLMSAVGLTDDVLHLKPATKLVAQLALAAALLQFGYRLNWLESMTLDTMLTLVWVVGLTNAFNLIDNMDGLCSGIALVAGGALLVELLAVGPPVPPEAVFLAILLGATAGFLVYNTYPASIFLGDSGSLLLGFSLAALTLSTGHNVRGRSDILVVIAGPVLVLLIPILDTTLVTLSRWTAGRRASQGGADHSSHRLVAIGLSEPKAVALLWFLAAIGGVLGIGLRHYGQQSSLALVAFGFVVAMTLFAVYLAGVRVYEDADRAVRDGTLTPLIVEFMYKRRVAEVVLDFCLATACYYAAYRMRFEDSGDYLRNFGMFLQSLPVVIALQLVTFFVIGVYRGEWRHFGLADSIIVARGVFVGAAGSLVTVVYGYQFYSYSRTVFVIYALLLMAAVTLSRASFRLVGDFMQRQRQTGRRVVIYGAGDGGGLVINQLLGGGTDARIVGFVDDDPRKAGNRVRGYPVLGGFSALTVLIQSGSVDTVIISPRQMPPERLNNLRVLCADAGIPLSQMTVGMQPLVEENETRPSLSPRSQVRQFPS